MKYFGFDGREEVFSAFGHAGGGERIIIAAYQQEGYEGHSFVLFSKGRLLFEVNGSHCSYYGLGAQWVPEPVTKAQLLARLRNGGTLSCGPEVDEAVKKFCTPKRKS